MMASFHSPKADSSTTSTVSPSSQSSSSLSSLLQLEPQSSSTAAPQKMNDSPDSGSVSIHSKLSHSDSNLFGRFCFSLNLISKKKSMTLDNRHAKNKKNKSGSTTLSSAALKKPKICQKLFDDNVGDGEDDDVVVVVVDEDSSKKPDLDNSDVKPIGVAATCLNSSLSSGDKRQTRTTKSASSPSKSPSSSSSWLHSSISFINCCITRTDSVSDIGKIQTNGLTKSGAKCKKSTSVPCSSASSSKQPLNKNQLNQRQIPMKLFVNYDLPCSSSCSSSSQSLSSTPPIPVPQSLASVQSSPAQSKQLISSPNNLNNSKTACVVSDRSRSLSPSAFCSTLNTSSFGSTMSSASGSSRQPFRRNHHNNNSELELLDQTSEIQGGELQNRDIGDEDMPIAAIEEHFRKFILEFNAHRTVSNPNGDNSSLQVPSSSSGMGGFISGQYPYRILNPSMNISNPVNNNDDKDINNSQQSASSAHTDGNMPKNFAELDRQSDQSHKRYKNSIHTQIDYANCLVPDLLAISNCSFYWGKMDRYEAERLLENKPEGTFLLRDSAQEDHLFSVSFRRFDRSLHARIEQWKHRFSFDSHDPGVYSSTTVTGLIEHYKDPSHCMFFEPMLTRPLNRTEPFSLQHLARVTISDRCTYETVNQLPIPIVLKCYLKEYHYRQKVRTKHFDEITYLDDFYYN